MTDHHASAGSGSEQDHSPAKTDGQAQASRHAAAEIMKTLLQRWRALMFLLTILIFGYYAFHYKAQSEPGLENKQLASEAPQYLDFFVSNPDISLTVTTQISQAGFYDLSTATGSLSEDLIVQAHVPPSVKSGWILMLGKPNDGGWGTHLQPPTSASDRLASTPSVYSEQNLIDGYVAALLPVPQPGGSRFNLGLNISNDVEITKDSVYGHLPSIGELNSWFSSDPDGRFCLAPRALLAETYKSGDDNGYGSQIYGGPNETNIGPMRPLRDLLLFPCLSKRVSKFPVPVSIGDSASSYRTPYGGPGMLFWNPKSLSIVQQQQVGVTSLADDQIDYMTPNAQMNDAGTEYTWHSSTYLAPTFGATDDGASQRESRAAFLSGIFFAVACAAAIAFVQEIPSLTWLVALFAWPVRWWRRKRMRESSQQDISPEKPHSTEGEQEEADPKIIKSPTGLGWPSTS